MLDEQHGQFPNALTVQGRLLLVTRARIFLKLALLLSHVVLFIACGAQPAMKHTDNASNGTSTDQAGGTGTGTSTDTGGGTGTGGGDGGTGGGGAGTGGGGGNGTGTQHSVVLSWTASDSEDVIGYNVYRGQQPGPPYTDFAKLNTSPIPTTTYKDSSVSAGVTYYYVATAVDRKDKESIASNQVSVIVPSP